MPHKLIRTATPGVYKRGPSYMVVFRHGEKQRKRYARTFDEARSIKRSVETDIARGEFRERSRIAFDDYAREWVRSYGGRTTTGLRESTRDGYRWSVQKAIAYFGTRTLSAIEPRDVRAYVAWLFDAKEQKRELSALTVRKHLGTVKVLLATAVEDGLLRASPATHTRVSRPEAKSEPCRVKAMEPEQLAAALNAVDPGWRAFLELLATTGLRIGEALELRWGDIDLGAKRLRVTRQVSKEGVVSAPKTSTGVRVIPLSTSLCQRLWRLQGAADDLLFTSPRGLHVDRRWLRRYVLDPATSAAGVPWATFHTFRHTCASLLFAAGKSPKQVQMWLGHTDPAFTLRVYVHLLDDGLGASPFDGAKWATGGQHEVQPLQANDDLPAVAESGA